VEICTAAWPPFDAVAQAIDTLDVHALERCSGADTLLTRFFLGSGTKGLSLDCRATIELAASIAAAGRAARAEGVATPELDAISAAPPHTGGGKRARAKRRGAEHLYLAVCDIPNLGKKINALLRLGLGCTPTLGAPFDRLVPKRSSPSDVVASLNMLAGCVRAFTESEAIGELLLLLRDVANGLNERKAAEVRDYRPAVGCSLLDLGALGALRVDSGTALDAVATLLEEAGRGDIFRRIFDDIGSIRPSAGARVAGASLARSLRSECTSSLRSAVVWETEARALSVAAESCSAEGVTVCAVAAARVVASNGAVREMEASAQELHGALHGARLKFAAHLDPSVARAIEVSSAASQDRARPSLLALVSARNAQRERDEFFEAVATFSCAARVVAERRETATAAKKVKKQIAKRAFAHDGGTRATAAAELAARRARAATDRAEAVSRGQLRDKLEKRRAQVEREDGEEEGY
jgi:hypothetical protein